MNAHPLPLSRVRSSQVSNHEKIVGRLQHSGLFQSYRGVFQASTGLPLELGSIESEKIAVCRGSVNQNQFCSLLNRGDVGCRQCRLAQSHLCSSESRGVRSITCFAGLQEAVVPVSCGSSPIALLKTGQIIHDPPNLDGFRKLLEFLDETGAKSSELEEAYMATPIIGKQQFQAILIMLAAFSLQLTKVANQIEKEHNVEDEDVIELARQFIEQNIVMPIGLDQVAKQVGMSPSHLCRRFKKRFGMTLTEFMTEHRVKLAREKLLESGRGITDIAFESGFQSLSQFNRCFRRETGMSPTKFRNRLTL